MVVNIEIHMIFKNLTDEGIDKIIKIIQSNLKSARVYIDEELSKNNLTYLVVELPDSFFLETSDKELENDYKLANILEKSWNFHSF